MGLEARKDKPKVKPKHKPKVAIVLNKPESQDQHDFQIKKRGEELDDNVARRKNALRGVGGNNEEVDTLTKIHIRREFKFKIAATFRLEKRARYTSMLKRSVEGALVGGAVKLKLQQEILLSTEPGKMSAKPYSLGLKAEVLGAILDLKGYQQEEKGIMCFGYALQERNFKFVFLGQVTRTEGETEWSARLKFTKQFKQGKLFANIKLDKPGSPGLKNLGAVIGFKVKEMGTFTVSMSGKKRFYFSFIREL